MRTILLCHQPDPIVTSAQSFDIHFDWLIETIPELYPDSRTIATWRVEQRPDRLIAGYGLQAEAIAPHRSFYLDLLAPRQLSNGRGLVYPIARGRVMRHEKKAEQLLLDLSWLGEGIQQLAISPDGRVQCLRVIF
ncbi:MAG: hypothetical protein AAFY11_09055 [Cyanobacteria bacterium J06641_5]